MSLYKHLGVEPNAQPWDIKKAYRRKAMKHHPDRGGDPAQFAIIQHANAVLSDETRRQRYDKTGQDTESPDLAQQAFNSVCQLVVRIIDASDPQFDNPLDTAKAHVHAGMAKLDSETQRLQVAIERREKAITWAKRKGGATNMLASFIQADITQRRKEQAAIAEQTELAHLMLEVLDDYEFRADPAPQQSFVCPSGFTFGTTGTSQHFQNTFRSTF